jgi:hypothetical protein
MELLEPKAKSHRVSLFPLALSLHFASSSHCSFNIGHVRSGNSIGSLIDVTLWTSIWNSSLWISCVWARNLAIYNAFVWIANCMWAAEEYLCSWNQWEELAEDCFHLQAVCRRPDCEEADQIIQEGSHHSRYRHCSWCMPPDGNLPCGRCSPHRFQCYHLWHYHG